MPFMETHSARCRLHGKRVSLPPVWSPCSNKCSPVRLPKLSVRLQWAHRALFLRKFPRGADCFNGSSLQSAWPHVCGGELCPQRLSWSLIPDKLRPAHFSFAIRKLSVNKLDKVPIYFLARLVVHPESVSTMSLEAAAEQESLNCPYEMNDLLELMVDQDASDLHIQVNQPPTLRISGSMVPVDGPPLTPSIPRPSCRPSPRTPCRSS
jgi:hypothetical protein